MTELGDYLKAEESRKRAGKNKQEASAVHLSDGLEGFAAMKKRIDQAHKEQERINYNMLRDEDRDVALKLMKDYFFRDMLEIWKAL